MSGYTIGNYLTENELIPGQHARGPWLTMNEVRPQFISHPSRHHQSFGGLGSPDELSRVRAERGQIQAEIERLQKGGRPVVGGFQPRVAATVSPAQAVAQARAVAAEAEASLRSRRAKKIALVGLGVAGLATAFLLKKKR